MQPNNPRRNQLKALPLAACLLFCVIAVSIRSTASEPCRSGDIVSGMSLKPDGKSFLITYRNGLTDYWEINGRLPQHPYQFAGHTDKVLSTAFSPDGKTIATGSRDGTVKLWDVVSGALLRTLQMEAAYADSMFVLFTPDGETLLTTEPEGLRIWDVSSGSLIWALRINHIYEIQFLPDNKTIMIMGEELSLWDIQTGKRLLVIGGYQLQLTSVALAPDGKTVLTGNYDGTARLWDLRTGKIIHIFGTPEEHYNAILSTALSSDGKFAAMGFYDGVVTVWNLQSGMELYTISLDSQVSKIAYAPDGETFLTATLTAVQLWDASSGKLLATFDANNAAFTPDGKMIIGLKNTPTSVKIQLWDAESQILLHISPEYEQITSVSYTPDGSAVLIGHVDGTADLYDLHSDKLLQEFPGNTLHTNVVSAMTYSPDGQTILTASWDGSAKLWDSQTGVLLRTVGTTSGGIAFSPDSKTVLTSDIGQLASGGLVPNTVSGGGAQLWDVSSGALIRTFKQSDGVASVAFAPDGKTILTGGGSIARLWDVQSGEILHELKTNGDAKILLVAYAPGGDILFIGGYGVAELWDARSGQRLRTFPQPVEYITSVAFSPDGKTVLTAEWNGRVKVWNVQSGTLLYTLAWLTVNGETRVAYLPDGKTALTSSWDGLLQLWNVPSHTLIKTFCWS
jgi:WD40 repeat protein